MLEKFLRCVGVGTHQEAARKLDDDNLIARHEAAATIQRRVRTKRTNSQRVAETDLRDAAEREHSAASKIASKARGHRARVTFAELKEQFRTAEVQSKKEEEEAAAREAAKQREEEAAALAAADKVEREAAKRAETEASAITSIQTRGRALLARAELARRRESRARDEREAAARAESAATTIARATRGHRARAVEAPRAKLLKARAELQQLPPLKKGSRQLPGLYMVRTVTLSRDETSLVYTKPGRSDPRAATHLRLAEMDAIIVQGEDVTVVMHFEPEPYVFRTPSAHDATAFGSALNICVQDAKRAEAEHSGSTNSSGSRVAVLRKQSEKVAVGVTFQYVKQDAGGAHYSPHSLPSMGAKQLKGTTLPPVLRQVAPKSLAASAGLRVGDLVAAINGVPITTNVQAAEMLRRAVGEVEVIVRPAEYVQLPSSSLAAASAA